jgi:hypothetical protein
VEGGECTQIPVRGECDVHIAAPLLPQLHILAFRFPAWLLTIVASSLNMTASDSMLSQILRISTSRSWASSSAVIRSMSWEFVKPYIQATYIHNDANLKAGRCPRKHAYKRVQTNNASCPLAHTRARTKHGAGMLPWPYHISTGPACAQHTTQHTGLIATNNARFLAEQHATIGWTT